MKHFLLLWLLVGASWVVCAQNPNYRYTLYLKLHSIKADRVVEGPFDDKEDLRGFLKGFAQAPDRRPVVLVKEIGDRQPNGVDLGFQVGTSARSLDQEVRIADRLTYEQIGDLEVCIGGQFEDFEIGIQYDYQMLNSNRIEQPRRDEYRCFKLKDIASFMSDLKTMPSRPDIRAVKFGRDTFAEAQFREKDKGADGSQITVFWQFRVIVSD